MNAYEANEISEQAAKPMMSGFYNLIRKQAHTGAKRITIDISDLPACKLKNVITELRNEGYVVEQDSYGDYKGSWNNLVISW